MISEETNIPKHIAIILDGNRRWAKQHKLQTLLGHYKGYQKLKTIPKYFFDHGVKAVSVYVFSTENWNRSKDEVDYLMEQLKEVLTKDIFELNEQGTRLLISGRIEELPGDLPNICRNAVIKTSQNKSGILNICLNYGGRPEIVDAIKKIIRDKVDVEQINEEFIRKYLFDGNSQLPDPDIIVRTGGDKRLSNFLMWESVYSEFVFIDKFWPDFDENDADMVIEELNKRERRFGGDSKVGQDLLLSSNVVYDSEQSRMSRL